MSKQQLLTLKKPEADAEATPEQIAAFLKKHGLVVMPTPGTPVPNPGTSGASPAFDWKYDAPIVVEHKDYSHLPPPGARSSTPISPPAKKWGNPALLAPEPRPGIALT